MPFINPSDKRWEDILSQTAHDFYHLPGYSETEADLLGGEAVAWYREEADDRYLVPLVKRAINGQELYDLVSPYGYPGVLVSRPLSTDQAADLLTRFHMEARQAGFVSSFLRLNPLLNPWNFSELPADELPFTQIMHGETVSIDMQPSIASIRAQFSENHKRHLKKLIRFGYQLAINDWSFLRDFITAYQQTMARKSARAYYFFPSSYFEKLKKLMGNRLVLITVSDRDGKLLSGGLFTQFGKIMQYHLGGTTDEALAFSPSKMVMDAAILYGKLNDAEILHLGGGLSANTSDGLFRFKKGFGSRFHPFSTLRFIHHPGVYQKLTDGFADQRQDKDYFPGYRNAI